MVSPQREQGSPPPTRPRRGSPKGRPHASSPSRHSSRVCCPPRGNAPDAGSPEALSASRLPEPGPD
eukprot:10409279-Alexandrium_andersonii.AAC.1